MRTLESGKIALCIDEATLRNPKLIGLDDEQLDAQEWLDVFLSGESARTTIGMAAAHKEAWVVSSEDIEPINLAATLKADYPSLCVRLIEFDGCGSLFSRANTAGIDEVLDRGAFLRCYANEKQQNIVAEPISKEKAQAPLFVEEASVCATVEPPIHYQDEPVAAALTQATPSLLSSTKSGRAFLMPVVSGSGGAGKSSVAVMAAFIAHSLGFNTLLLDYDLQFGDAAVMAGIEKALAIDEVMARPDLLEREVKRNPGFTVLAAPARLESAEEVIKDTPPFLDELTNMFDVIIANTGAAWAEQHAVLLERSSAALFLIDQRASSVRACRHALELCARCGIASGPFQFVLNRCSKNAPLTSIDVSCALQGAPVFELKDGGRDVEDFLGGGAAAELLETRNDFCSSLKHVMTSLLPGFINDAQIQNEEPEARRSQKRRGRHVGRKRGWN